MVGQGDSLKSITIRSEKQAFDLLEKAVKDELDDQPFTLQFHNWPILEIKLEGEGYESAITADIAGALIEVQRAVNRAYARTVHHTSNSRNLTDTERQDIQFKATVEKGSSLIKINLGDFAEKLATAIPANMTPTTLTITILGLAIAGGSVLALKALLKSRTSDKQIEQDARTKIAMSQEETRRMEIFAKAVSRVPEVGHARQDFDDARLDIVRAARDADSITVNSVELDNATARVIGAAKRSQSEEIQLNGNYIIVSTDLRKPEEVRLRVQSAADGREFVASFNDKSLKGTQIALLQDAEWSRAPVYLSINARALRGEITAATVIEVKAQPVKR